MAFGGMGWGTGVAAQGINAWSPAAIAMYKAIGSRDTSQDRMRALAHGFTPQPKPTMDAQQHKLALLMIAAQRQQQSQHQPPAAQGNGLKPQAPRTPTGADSNSMGPPGPPQPLGPQGKGGGKSAPQPLPFDKNIVGNAKSKPAPGFAGGAKPGAPPQAPQLTAPGAGPGTVAPAAAQQFATAVHNNQVMAWTQAANQSDWQGQGVDQWIQRAAAAEGVSPQDYGNLKSALAKEASNFDPNAINLTDSNAAKGTPSIGPAQVIQPTFDAHADPGWSIRNPIHNIRAGIRYAKGRYGANWLRAMMYGQDLTPGGGGGY